MRGGPGPGAAELQTLALVRQLADELGGEAHMVALGPPPTAGSVADGAEAGDPSLGSSGADSGHPGAEAKAKLLGGYGADRVFVGESEELALYQPDVAAEVVGRLAAAGEYGAVVFPATALGKDLAPRVGARLGRGVASDVVGCWVEEDGTIAARRPVYAGKAIATLRFREGPAVMTIRANVFAPEAREGKGAISAVDLGGIERRVRTVSFERRGRGSADVSEASIVVSGGRGMQGPEHWGLLEELVDALGEGAALGASRAVVDAGWRPHGEQVGQTGKVVSPNLYFAIGISGAIQHLAGMRTSKVIVAVNRDADAPIFGVADYGVVGDVFEVLPALAEAIRGVRQDG